MAMLAQPSWRYKTSFLQAVREFQANGERLDYDYDRLDHDFTSFAQSLLKRDDPARIASGRVPETIFWLVEGDEFIGRVSIRHKLNEALRQVGGHIGYEIRPSKRRQGYGKLILKLALPEAKKLGIKRAMITCNYDNIGSKKIIEANGGQLEREITLEDDPVSKLHYWLDLTL